MTATESMTTTKNTTKSTNTTKSMSKNTKSVSKSMKKICKDLFEDNECTTGQVVIGCLYDDIMSVYIVVDDAISVYSDYHKQMLYYMRASKHPDVNDYVFTFINKCGKVCNMFMIPSNQHNTFRYLILHGFECEGPFEPFAQYNIGITNYMISKNPGHNPEYVGYDLSKSIRENINDMLYPGYSFDTSQKVMYMYNGLFESAKGVKKYIKKQKQEEDIEVIDLATLEPDYDDTTSD
jgi:hypothetical protein